ncbi:MAG: hypothetical protein KL787_10245 [Taibaiella sp.]|nr:hypothetical protein [Taibaiella sp.]
MRKTSVSNWCHFTLIRNRISWIRKAEKIDGEITVTKQRMVYSTNERYDYSHDTEEMEYGETDSITYVYGAYRGTTPETNKPDTVYDYTEIGGDLYNTGFYEYNEHDNVTYYQSDNEDGTFHSERTVTYFDGMHVQKDTSSQVTESLGLYLCVENDGAGNEIYNLRIQDAPEYPPYYNYKQVYWRAFEDGGKKTYQLMKFRYFTEEAGYPNYDEYSYYDYGAFEISVKDSIVRVYYKALDSTAIDYERNIHHNQDF